MINSPEDLFALYDRMIGDVDIHQVLHHVTEVVRGKLNADAATTYLVREDTQELESVAIVGNVKQLVERFNGTMALESEENRGSTFTVRLPMAQE